MPKLKIVVEATGRPKSEPLFSLHLQISYPYSISQSLILTFSRALKVQEYILGQYKDSNIPRIDQRPEHISYMEASKNKSTIV